MTQHVFEILLKKGLTIGFAESMTGGFCTYRMVENPGASKVIKGSVVAYTSEAKITILGIESKHINEKSSVSKDVAIAMAHSIKSLLKTDIGVGITGNAGPGLEPNTTLQMAWIAIKSPSSTKTYRVDLQGFNRLEAIHLVTHQTYCLLEEILREL